MNTIVPSSYALQAIDAFAATKRSCRVVGRGNPPPLPYYQNGWRLDRFSISDLESTTHAEILRRLAILDERGIKYSHILIAHEEQKPQLEKLELQKKVKSIASDVLPVLGEAVAAVGAAVEFIALALGHILLFVLLADPVVIVVLDDDRKTWLEVAKWYD